MEYKRLVIEIGQGVDMHGGDQNNAILKATKDAIHHCCIAGLSEIFEIEKRKGVKLVADVYVPDPDNADPNVVSDYMGKMYDDVKVNMHVGGADPEVIALDGDPKTPITIALVVITVWVEA